MKKQIIATMLFLSIWASVLSPALAFDEQDNVARFQIEKGQTQIEIKNSDVYVMQEPNSLLQAGEQYSVVDIEERENSVFKHTMHIDMGNDLISYLDVDGNVISENALSDIVTITNVAPEDAENQPLTQGASDVGSARITDWIDYEEFTINPSTGLQNTVFGAPVFDGYEYLGNRGDFYTAPGQYGYLQRQNAGQISTGYAKKFTFSAGTGLSTAVGIIISAVTGTGIVLAVLTGMAAAVLGSTIDYARSVTFEVNDFRWNYRTRLNGNVGAIIDTAYRTRSFWKLYEPSTGARSYEQRGAVYNEGFIATNLEMIRGAIENYFGV